MLSVTVKALPPILKLAPEKTIDLSAVPEGRSNVLPVWAGEPANTTVSPDMGTTPPAQFSGSLHKLSFALPTQERPASDAVIVKFAFNDCGLALSVMLIV